MLADVRISSASYEDLPEVARIHVAAWKQAYVGQVPQAHLDRLDVAQRLQRWQEQFPDGIVSGLLLAKVKEKPAGFVCFGRARDGDRPHWAEIYAIYVLESYWGGGLGWQLFKYCCAELQHSGFTRACLWALDTNRRAIAAYKRWGGSVEQDRLKDHEIGGQPVKEVSVSFLLD
ncbi:MAG: GNAT family N-acetyltransferase [Acidobacteriaceae bacterium]|nr:GNAT family N-acetyltransferase [Acidobacteriaceae bacterium]